MARMVVGPDASDTDLRGAIRNILKSKVELDSGYARATKNDDGGSPYAVFSNKGTTSYIGGRNSTSNVRNFNREEFNEFKSRAFDLIGKTYDSGTNYSPTVRAQAYEAFMQEQAWREAAGVPREYDPVE